MIIRKMTIDEYDKIDSLMQQLHQLHFTNRPDLFIDLEHPYSKEEYKKLLTNKDVIAIAAEENGKIIGICFVTIKYKSNMVSMPIAYMDDLIVDKAFRHRGVAKALFSEAENQAKLLGAVRMDLMVWSFNESAKNLYESLGMKPQRYIYEKNLR